MIDPDQDPPLEKVEGEPLFVDAPALKGKGLNPKAFVNPYVFASQTEVVKWSQDAEFDSSKSTHLIDTPERDEMRLQAKYNMLAGENEIRAERKVVIVLGPPGAGKSTMVKPLLDELGAVEIDADIAKQDKLFAEDYAGGFGASKVHRESQQIAQEAKLDAVSGGYNIVEAVVGKDYQKVIENIAAYKAAGYDVQVQLVDVTTETSVVQAFMRFYETGRYVVPEYILLDVGQNPQLVYIKLLDNGIISLNDWRVLNNDGQIDEEYEVSPEQLRETVSARQVSDASQRRRCFGIDAIRDGSSERAGSGRSGDTKGALEETGEVEESRIRGILCGAIKFN